MASMQVHQAVAKKEYNPKQFQNGTMATINNLTQSQMSLDRFMNWAGHPATGSFPSTIARNRTAQFTHVRGGNFGSVAAVQYSGYNALGALCAWIVAWNAPSNDTPPDCPPNRVYAECGSKKVMDAITWDQILSKLDIAPTDYSDSDPSTKTSVDATIQDYTAAPTSASLIADFKLTS
ncbi:jasmonate-induced protein homolog [Silene latifolia]|uniref:jasmonate-induced protein homolog n=1 Tax=Silene latifolia TaxID=37657 RepID=UPI003D772814